MRSAETICRSKEAQRSPHTWTERPVTPMYGLATNAVRLSAKHMSGARRMQLGGNKEATDEEFRLIADALVFDNLFPCDYDRFHQHHCYI